MLTNFELTLNALPILLTIIPLHGLVVLQNLHELLAQERGLCGSGMVGHRVYGERWLG